MSVKEEIYKVVGEIIKLIQYIEWNLCIELDIDGLSEYTLGQIKNMIIEKEIFSEFIIDKLIVILDRRNDLVHKYFKRLDFEKHSSNQGFLDNQYRYLCNYLEQVEELNDLLVGESNE